MCRRRNAERVAAQLNRHVPELSEGSWRLTSCTPERLRAKEHEWLARYRLDLVGPAGEAREVALVGRLWAPSQPRPGALSDRAEDEAPFPAAGWGCWLPELGLALRVEASDEALPALPLLVEPAAASGLLGPILRDARYPDAAITSCRPAVVRYKPGSRCTVVVRLDYADDTTGGPTPPTPVVLKTHQGGTRDRPPGTR